MRRSQGRRPAAPPTAVVAAPLGRFGLLLKREDIVQAGAVECMSPWTAQDSIYCDDEFLALQLGDVGDEALYFDAHVFCMHHNHVLAVLVARCPPGFARTHRDHMPQRFVVTTPLLPVPSTSR